MSASGLSLLAESTAHTGFVPATRPRAANAEDRLLVIDPKSNSYQDAKMTDLGHFLVDGDVIILNDAATLPASIPGRSSRGGATEVRLCGIGRGGSFRAVLLGEGDWRTPTEHRAAPELFMPGDRIHFRETFWATIEAVEPLSPRLVHLRFSLEGSAFWRALYAYGRPIQYSYMDGPLELWSVQNCYACRPWAAERPSAGRALTIAQLVALSHRGVHIAAITHESGLSSTGDPVIDAALPLTEWFDIPAGTVAAVERARARGSRVLAAGTTVVRTLESSVAHHGRLVAGEEETDLIVGPEHRLKVVDGLLTGLHEATVSHYRLMLAFASAPLLNDAYHHAQLSGYLGHEFGDVSLILPNSIPTPTNSHPPRSEQTGGTSC